MMVCIQCAMRALLDGKEVPRFEEDPVAHMVAYHPDPVKTQEERRQMEQELSLRWCDVGDKGTH